MMRTMLKYAFPFLVVLLASSCIENDLSFPDMKAEIISLELEGQSSITIDNESRRIEVVMGEAADMANVRVLGMEVTEGAEVIGGMPEFLDLRDSVSLTLKVYEEFVWTISATRPIARYIRCENQIGEAVLNLEEKSAFVYVSEDQSLKSVTFNEVKLEPEGAVIESTKGFIYMNGESVPLMEQCEFPMTLDCVIMRYFYVQYKGEEIRWSVKVLQKAVEVEVNSVCPWACFAKIKGVTNGEGSPAFEYRKSSEAEWTRHESVSVNGKEVSAEIRGLQPETEYLVRLTTGFVTSGEKTFRTESAVQPENMSFDNWYLSGKVWMPDTEGGPVVWDTANPGSADLGYTPTTPETEIVVKGKAARLETQLAKVAFIKRLAAGNIYTGKFGKIAGVGAELDWGVPFASRPLALRGYLRYIPAVIDTVDDPYKDKLGETDECQIQIFLAEWTEPFHVNTSKKQFVDYSDRSIIAYAEYCSSERNDEYIKFTMPIVYNDDRMPTYIVMSGCASKYGNYFTGGVGSLLYIDEFELVYDPEELTEDEYNLVFSKL